jgi:predicted amidophosphoribosyltransferase
VAHLSVAIDEHPLLRAVDAVIAVPGHDSRQVSFGARVATAVARDRGVPLVKCASAVPFRTPAKDLDPSARAGVISNQFRCHVELSGQTVLIVDDLYGSGTTVGEVGRAASVNMPK